ncbi:MAG: ATP-binding protein [Thermoanaerobaculia bacterium]
MFESRLEPLRDAAGEIRGVAGLAIDVTDARRSSIVERALLRISAEASRAIDLPAFFASLHAVVGELMYARNFYLALVDPAQETLSFPYFVDEFDTAPGPRPLGRGLTEYVLRTGRPLHAPREVDRELVEAGEVSEVGAPSVDWMGVPLASGDQVFGVVAVQSYRDDVRFDERDLEVLAFVGQHISAAYERRQAEQDLRESQEQLRHAQKMEALGRMAGGVAHDFNNLLTVISGYAELLGRRLPPDSPHQAELAAIERAGRRAGELTSQLLAVGRKQPSTPRLLHLGEFLASLRSWLERLAGSAVDLRIETDPALWPIRADPAQIEQVVLNLVANARDAMPDGGELVIAARNRDLDDTAARHRPGLERGSYIVLEVRDDGCGMDRATIERIFEPFFTTKEKGKGTGLGLSSVYGIVRQHGGSIEVESSPGAGASFQLFLPRVAGEPEDDTVDVALPVPSGGETALLAEDEEAVRALLVEVLTELGYELLVAVDGREALAVAARAGRIDLLLSDIVMPHLGGIELAGRLRAERPGLPVVLLSGYADNLPDGAGEAGMRLISKPVSVSNLTAVLRELLDARAER